MNKSTRSKLNSKFGDSLVLNRNILPREIKHNTQISDSVADCFNTRPEVVCGNESGGQLPIPLPISCPWIDSSSEENPIIAMSKGTGNLFEQGRRSIIGQDQTHAHTTSCEPIQRERKRWVRPPLVGEAASDTPVLIGKSVCLETVECDNGDQMSSNMFKKDVHTFDFKMSDTQTITELCAGNKAEIDYTKEHSGLYKTAITHAGRYHPSTVFKDTADIQDRMLLNNNRGNYVPGTVAVSEKSLSGDMNVTPVLNETTHEGGGARAPSPCSVSSVNSGRRLEWDSGADVGYQDTCLGIELSTIERIALARGCSAAMLMRLEPEGKSGPIKQNTKHRYVLLPPKAESTPVERVGDQDGAVFRATSTTTESEGEITPIVRQPIIFSLSTDQQHLISTNNSENKKNVNQMISINDNENRSFNSNVKLFNLSKKNSNSLTDLSMWDDNIQSCDKSLPRSRSDLNLLEQQDDERQTTASQLPRNVLLSSHAATCSVSSSSIATVVQKREPSKTLNKLIQTVSHIPTKLSVGVQASENQVISEMCKLSVAHSGMYPHSRNSDHHLSSSSSGKSRKGSQISIVRETDNSVYQNSSKESNSKASDFQTVDSFSQLGKHHPRTPTNQQANSLYQAHKCTGAHRKEFCVGDVVQSKDSIQNSSRRENIMIKQLESQSTCAERDGEKDSSQNDNRTEGFNTLESAASSTQTAGSWYAAETPRSGTGPQCTGSAEVLGSAHSFEYLPGHMYENSVAAGVENGIEHSAQELSVTNKLLHSETLDKSSSTSSTLERELQRGVKLFEELLARKSYDSKVKKELIRRVINRLEVDFPEDHDEDARTAALDSNVPWVPFSQWSEQERPGSVSSTCFQPAPGAALRYANLPTATMENTPTSSSLTTSRSTSLPTQQEDSRAESTTATSLVGKPDQPKSNWRTLVTNSERKLECSKQNQKQPEIKHNAESALLDFCKSERENQLYWIQFEIEHLSSLKQLLQKQEGLKRNLASLVAHEHRSLRLRPVISSDKEQKINQGTNSHSTCPSSSKHTSHPQSSALPTSSDSPDGHNWASHHYLLSRKESNAKVPNCVEGQRATNRMDSQTLDVAQEELRQNCFTQTHTPNSDPQSGTGNSTLGSLLDNSVKNGRINVYAQTKHQQLRQPREQSTERQKHKKDKLEDRKVPPKCCCECKRILRDIVESRKSTIDKHSNKSSIADDNNICSKCQVSKRIYNNNRHSASGQFPPKASSSNISALSIETSRTSGDAVEISIDSKDKSNQKATENVGVQTTNSLNKLWYSENTQRYENSNKKPNVQDKGVNMPSTREEYIKCSCCGLLRETENMAKLQGIREYCKCNLPGVDVQKVYPSCNCKDTYVEKQVKQTVTSQGTVNNSNKSYQIVELCPCCGKSEASGTKETIASPKGIDRNEATSPTIAPLELSHKPLAYILTFEPTPEENSIKTKDKRNSLPEIKIKIPLSIKLLENHKPEDKEQSESSLSRKLRSSSSKENERPHDRKNVSGTEYSEAEANAGRTKTHKLTLQEYLRVNRPDYIECADKRQQCVADLAYLRELRHEGRRRLLALTGTTQRPQTAPGRSQHLRPARRVFSQRTMRAQTERKFQKLAEVQNKKSEIKKKEDYRTNRLMAEIFTKKLQKKTLNGQVNLSNSVSVISSF